MWCSKWVHSRHIHRGVTSETHRRDDGHPACCIYEGFGRCGECSRVQVLGLWDNSHGIWRGLGTLAVCAYAETEQKGMLLHTYSVSYSGSTKLPISVRVSQVSCHNTQVMRQRTPYVCSTWYRPCRTCHRKGMKPQSSRVE